MTSLRAKVPVVAAIIEQDGRFLLGRRASSKASAPGYWCPVTGAVERGESPAQAVVREVREEVGLVVEALHPVALLDTRDQSARIEWWRVRIVAGEAHLCNDEHTELRWVTLDEMAALEPMFPEDRAMFVAVAER
jgi:8-oxo-dGTP pyrophosphatase MutT (NUDIX family)